MKLRGVDFGKVLCASGVKGFFGEGYWFHNIWRPLGLDFAGATFVSKTATLRPRDGNMLLARDYTPKELFPSCVKMKFFRGAMLNSVGLSNPGLNSLLASGEWQGMTEPFFISIMAVGDTPSKRVSEIYDMIMRIKYWKEENVVHRGFAAPFGVQVNLSCPNTGHDVPELIKESEQVLDIAEGLHVPIMPKYSIDSAPIDAIVELGKHPNCDAICVSNTIKFGSNTIDWKKAWGEQESPLEDLGGGGLSGAPIRPLVCDWIKRVRDAGFTKPINGGGGILSCDDVRQYRDAGASSVFLGSVAALRPWRVKSIIKFANSLEWKE